MKVMIDTNVLIDYPDVISKYDTVVIPSIILEEVDGLKRDKMLGAKARIVSRAIKEAKNIELVTTPIYRMPDGWDEKKVDNKLIMCAKKLELPLISNDIAVGLKARSVGVECTEYVERLYTGYLEITGTDDEITDQMNSLDLRSLLENQYVILKYNDGSSKEMVYRRNGLDMLSLPDSSVIKGYNSKQRCALDLLMNKNIPIKIISGVAGSGKTKMTVALGLHFIMDKKYYNKVVLVRNPIGSGMDIGFLPGEFSTKTDAFYAPIVENVDNPEIISFLIEHGMLEKKIPYHMKGLTMKDSYVIIDEAEDLDLKTLRLIGGRIGSNSVMIFSGDFAQTEDRFINDNGLIKLINDSKGHPLVGIVILDENVRSSASQVFMNLKY